MAKNLEELRDELYEAFNLAKEKAANLKSLNIYSYPEQAKSGAQMIQGMAMTAASIVQVEHELAEQGGPDKALVKPRPNPLG